MTDSAWDGPPCHRCKGKGEIVFTRGNHWSSIRCEDCRGTGLAGTPPPGPLYEDREYDPETDGPLPAVWTHPAVNTLPWCHMCLGAGVVVSATLIELPCPACRPERS